MKKLISIILILFHGSVFAYEDLTELEARISRKSSQTFYSGEDSGNYYIWQPQMVRYTDTSTNKEVWIWSRTDDKDCMNIGTEFGYQPWSADGARFALSFDKDVGNYTRSGGQPWFVAKSDGTYMRPFSEGPNRTTTRLPYWSWSPTEPDVAYQVGYNSHGNTGLDQNGLYKVTVSDTSGSKSLHVDLIGGDTSTIASGGMKSPITGDGKFHVSSAWAESTPLYYADLTTPALEITYTFPSLDTYWGSTTLNPTDFHDEYLTGNATEGYWLYHITPDCWWRQRITGTDSNAPDHTIDNSTPYDWWTGTDAQKEIQPVNSKTSNFLDFQGHYWSHASFDRWGIYAAFSGSNGHVAPEIWNIDTSTQTAYPGSAVDVIYSTWNNFSDYAFFSGGTSYSSMHAMKYNDANDTIDIAELHSSVASDFSHPGGGSPDGTKMTLRSDWLNPTNLQSDLFMGVAKYPHPPEVDSVSATSGTVTVTVWWDLAGDNRGYSSRGWPDESADDPPPPREINLFRLWRSLDGTNWSPIKTFNHDIWDKYDFADGTWDSGTEASNKWTVTDAVADNTYYYAVTSIEHSGLESRTVSNVFSITVSSGAGTGSQSAAYPASPGGGSGVTTSYDSDLHSHYQIYAEDGSTPTISQVNLIASDPRTVKSYVDWLGNSNDTTQYVVTAVDTQGNESSALSATRQTDTPNAGLYTITWVDEVGGDPGTATTTRIGTGTITYSGTGSQTRN